MKKTGSYKFNGFSNKERILANCDKASANGDSCVIHTPWGGKITMYHINRNGNRFYSTRDFNVHTTGIPNCGSLRISSLRRFLENGNIF